MHASGSDSVMPATLFLLYSPACWDTRAPKYSSKIDAAAGGGLSTSAGHEVVRRGHDAWEDGPWASAVGMETVRCVKEEKWVAIA
eukprot:2653763-Rhodomonas_salina.3